jgi:hypothetical protein
MRKMSKPTSLAVCAFVSLLLCPAALAGLVGIDIAQISFLQGADTVLNSDWGSASITYTPSTSFQFFNLVVNGSWQVQNVPVASLSTLNSTQSMTFDFNLGVPRGMPAGTVSYVALLADAPLNGPPTGTPVNTTPAVRDVTVGGLAGPLGPIPAALPLIGKLPIDFAFNFDMVNQDVGVDECAPGAFSNSLMWLDRNGALNIPANLKSVDGLKGPTNWSPPMKDVNGNPIPGTGGVPVNAYLGKGAALSAYVTTRFITPANIADALAEMKRGEDIEIWGDHHAAVASGIIRNLDGTWTIYATHDTMQGAAGGTVTEPIVFDPATGLLTGGAPGFFGGFQLRGFVDESPVPEPVPMLLVGTALCILGVRKQARRTQS